MPPNASALRRRWKTTGWRERRGPHSLFGGFSTVEGCATPYAGVILQPKRHARRRSTRGTIPTPDARPPPMILQLPDSTIPARRYHPHTPARKKQLPSVSHCRRSWRNRQIETTPSGRESAIGAVPLSGRGHRTAGRSRGRASRLYALLTGCRGAHARRHRCCQAFSCWQKAWSAGYGCQLDRGKVN